MSKTIKFTISDENARELEERAGNQSIQDYIRSILFPDQITITPMDAVNRALANYQTGDTFTVPEIFGEAWNLPNGMAGQFGRKFYNLVSTDYSTQIRFTGGYNTKRHAVYERL